MRKLIFGLIIFGSLHNAEIVNPDTTARVIPLSVHLKNYLNRSFCALHNLATVPLLISRIPHSNCLSSVRVEYITVIEDLMGIVQAVQGTTKVTLHDKILKSSAAMLLELKM